MKKHEKNERIIRGLLKHSLNRKCINCNLLGPQYVCTTFSTFVCTTCGGIHREFTHRVKSISMSKFTPQEIDSLQAGGNERAREIFFKEWDPQRQSAPDTSNVYRLRDFIKHVYVDRRYAGERTIDKPSQVPTESRRSDGYQSGSRSPPYNDMYEHGRASPGYDFRRNPNNGQDSQRQSDYGRSPGHSGVVNDWHQDDRFSNGRNSEDQRSSDGEAKSEIRSPDHEKDNNVSYPPVVRPVREIPGEISEPPKSNSSKVSDAPLITQRTTASSTSSSSAGNPTEHKRETSLIDFDVQPELPSTASAMPTPLSTTSQPVTQSASASSDDNWASFDNIPENNVSQAPPNSNSLEFVLTQLSVSSSAPVSEPTNSNDASMPSNDLFPSSGPIDLFAASVGNASAAASPGIPPTAATPILSTPVTCVTGQLSSIRHHQQSSHHGGQPAAQPPPSSFPRVSSNQGSTSNTAVQPAPQSLMNLAEPTVEDKSSGRKELPVDLFTMAHQPEYYQAPMWQGGIFPGMGYRMQFNPAMSMSSIPQPIPFYASLHAQLPNTAAPRGVVPAPNFGPTPSWTPPQSSSYSSTVPPLAQYFGSAMPGTYVSHQQPTNMAPSRPQVFGSFGGQGAFSSLNPAATTPNPSLGGNPFG